MPVILYIYIVIIVPSSPPHLTSYSRSEEFSTCCKLTGGVCRKSDAYRSLYHRPTRWCSFHCFHLSRDKGFFVFFRSYPILGMMWNIACGEWFMIRLYLLECVCDCISFYVYFKNMMLENVQFVIPYFSIPNGFIFF